MNKLVNDAWCLRVAFLTHERDAAVRAHGEVCGHRLQFATDVVGHQIAGHGIDVQAQAYAQLIRRISWESESDLTRDELELIFKQCVGKIPDGKQKFTSFLRHHGINLTRLRLGNGRTYIASVSMDF